MIMVFLSVFHRYATMLVGTVARYARNKNESCHRKTCTWHAGTNTANVNVTDGVSPAMREAYGGHSCGGDDGLSGTGYPGRD